MSKLFVTGLCLLILGCRQDHESPIYAPERGAEAPVEDIYLTGPDPYVADEYRLDLGLFYEGPSSRQITLGEGAAASFYIFDGTFSLVETLVDPVEGDQADKLVPKADSPWFGGGIVLQQPLDLSQAKVLKISLKSAAPSFEFVRIGMKDALDVEVTIMVNSLGFKSNQEWHHIAIDLQKLADEGVDLKNVTIPFLLLADSADFSGDVSLFLDNLYVE